MKNFLFVLMLFSCFAVLFLGVLWNQFHPTKGRLKDTISLRSIEGEEIRIGKGTDHDTVLFSGYRNCATICASTLPILQKIAQNHKDHPLQVLFLDLSGPNPQPKELLGPKKFPNVKWILVEKDQAKVLLSQILLERANTDHHSSKVFLHHHATDVFEIVEPFSVREFEEWFQNSKKSLSSLSK